METDTHKWLKRIGLQFLKEKGMNVVVNEVPFKCGISDCCGLQYKRKECRIVEAKATYEDYKRDQKLFNLETSYFPECHYFYIICPENIIMTDQIIDGIGLIYVYPNDEYKLIKKPKKNANKLKTRFDTTLREAIKRLSNELYYKEEANYKDPTNNAFARSADIFYSAVRCPNCKHVTKELISRHKTKSIKCKNCKAEICLESAKVREIIGFNKTFIAKLKKLDMIEYAAPKN